MPPGGEALDVDDRGPQCRGREVTDAWDLEQSFDDRVVLVKALEFSIEMLATLLERTDFLEQIDEACVQDGRHGSRRVGERRSNSLDRALGSERDADAELAQASAKKVDCCRFPGHQP